MLSVNISVLFAHSQVEQVYSGVSFMYWKKLFLILMQIVYIIQHDPLLLYAYTGANNLLTWVT